MKIVSPMAIVTAVLLAALLVGCSSGPGKTPDEGTTPDQPQPVIQEFSGTFTVVPDANPLIGTITSTITGISHDGTALTGAEFAGAIAQLGGVEQTFDYTLAPAATMTELTLTGDLLTALELPGGTVTATRSGPPDPNPLTALNGTWTTQVSDPQTMLTTTLTLDVTAPDFTLTVDATPPSS